MQKDVCVATVNHSDSNHTSGARGHTLIYYYLFDDLTLLPIIKKASLSSKGV